MGIVNRSKGMDFFKMGVTRWIAVVLAVFTFATPTVLSAEPRVVCYYTNWSVYRPGTARFNPQNINPYLCTHLIYAFGGFTKDNTLKPFDKYQDIEKGGYAKFNGLKTYNKNLKTLLAIGGWNEGSSRFSPMVASREKRREFVKNAIKFLRQNHFDGLDLDWEYPAFRDGGKPKDRENYAKLVKELREEFQRESEKTNKPRLLLTMAVPAGIEYIQKGFDVKTLNEYLDWMNLLTYDYHSAFEPAVDHHAPLYPLEEPNEYSVDNELNIDYTIKFYLESGADADKLVLGIPTYGRSYTLFNADATEIGSPADGPGEQGDATREKGYLAYYEICESLKPKQKKKRSSDEEDDDDEEDEDQPWTVVQPNSKAMGPFAYKGNQWVGYDDIDIVKKKAEYVAENRLGGIMFWSIDNDDFRGTCHNKPYPLIEAAKEAYIGRLGSTDNAVVSTERPRSSNKRRNRPTSTTTRTTTRSQAPRKSSVASTTPSWNIVTPEPPTTPDPGSDFKCTDEGFFPHPRDCKKYFWCLDSGPSNLGIVAHHFTCPSGLFFNKAADSCDFARNVLCKKPAATTKPPKESTTKEPTTRRTTTTTTEATTTRKPIKLSTKSSSLFRTTSTTTTAEPEVEEEYEDEAADIDAEDPKVIKELIDLIKKVGGVEQLEKQLHLSEGSSSSAITTTPSSFNKKLYQKVLERTRSKTRFGNSIDGSKNSEASVQNSRGPQNEGLAATADRDNVVRKDRPQYTTINRSRQLPQFESPDRDPEQPAPRTEPAAASSRSRDAEPATPAAPAAARAAATSRPLQYVNIRRARPSDAADDTASRNALFERAEPYVSISETANSVDLSSARRENVPEYVTIRRQRPTVEETTTASTQPAEDEAETQDSQETALEREISSVASPQYTSIVRSRPSPAPPTPEPTTILAVQISSLLNSPNSEENDEITTEELTSLAPTTTTSTTTTTTTTTLSPPPRRIVSRRRSTTTTTAAPIVTTQQATKERRTFLRRTKATAPPETTAPNDTTDLPETTTNKYTRRGNSRFKSRTEDKITKEEIPAQTESAITDVDRTRPPSFRTTARTERPRKYVRRKLGGANTSSTTSTSPSPSLSTLPSSTRRPFRVASRRRPLTTITSRGTTTKATTTPPTTTVVTTTVNEESLQDISGLDFQTSSDTTSSEITSAEQERLSTSPSKQKKTVKIQRRPLTSLKNELPDQNPSATNEDESKRQSKKYSASFKQNQLDEVLKQKKQDVTTEAAIDEYNAETAIAIAAHQLMSAPPPIISDYDDQSEKTNKPSNPPRTTFEYSFTSPSYSPNPSTIRPLYSEEVNSPIFKSTITPEFTPSSSRTYLGQSPTGFTKTTTPYTSPPIFSTKNSPLLNQFSPSLGPSTARYLAINENKFLGVPVEDFGYSTSGFTGIAQEPSYFTREYLLESPTTKTFDDEYQYLSPTTPSPTTPKANKKIVYRKISTTLRPTTPVAFTPISTTIKPRRVPNKKPFEKVAKGEPNRTFRPVENYDYYDAGDDKVIQRYEEGTQVVLHGKGTIECLDIGNFPHPSSCKKFISCARMESGSIFGWEYICPKGLSFDPVGGMCNWSAGLGCDEKGA